jgi:heat shock protein HtpX
MELWSEPMSARMAAFLLASLVALLVLIGLEIRSHAATKDAQPPKHRELGPVTALIGMIVAPFAAIGFLFGTAGAAAAAAIGGAIVLWSFWHTGPAILAQCGARTTTDRDLIEAVQELAAKAGIPAPHLLEIDETHPNAFALGSDPAHAAILVTLGLLRRLTDAELRAVMAHEISHIAHRDTLRATLGVTLMGAIALLALRLRLIGPAARRQGIGALLFLAIFAPVSALVLRFAAPRARAYQTDQDGARLCGNPDDLIGALVKLDAATRRVAGITANDQPALAALFIVNPLPNSWVGKLFAGQPPIARRIERLKACSGEAESGWPPNHGIPQSAV